MTITRDPDTQAAIDLAREEPESMFVRGSLDCEHPGYNGKATLNDSKLYPTNSGCKSCDLFAWQVDNGKAMVLRGPELTAYRALRDAAAQAHAAQQSMATTGQALRDAIQKLCAVIAPGVPGGK